MARLTIIITLLLVLFSGVYVFANDTMLDEKLFNYPSEPRLDYPAGEQAILTGKDFLEFKWLNNYIGIRGFVFKIYKGYDMYEQGLLYKQNIPANISSVKIKSGLFAHGEIYTWSLFAIALDGQYGNKSFNSFKVIKQ